MKYGIDIGHNTHNDPGAVGIKVEAELTMAVGMLVISKLKALGHTVINTKPDYAANQGESLFKRVLIANQNNVDLFVSIHFNAGGGKGTEVYCVSEEGKNISEKILKEIVSLGYVNRGIKDGGRLYVIRKTKAPAILIECAFVDSNEDMGRYNGDEIARAIVRGLTGTSDHDYEDPKIKIISAGQNKRDTEILKLQKVLNQLKIRDFSGNVLKIDGIAGLRTESAVKKIQSILGISTDGIAGSVTWKGINSILKREILSAGKGNISAIRYVQWRVHTNIDGIFGVLTKKVVIEFQKTMGLAQDGIVGPKTWSKLIDN